MADITIDWTEMVFGANPISVEDAMNGGVCAITGVWYPARLLKMVNGRRIFVRIPMVQSQEPTDNVGIRSGR